jgi:hypothetical protein
VSLGECRSRGNQGEREDGGEEAEEAVHSGSPFEEVAPEASIGAREDTGDLLFLPIVLRVTVSSCL